MTDPREFAKQITNLVYFSSTAMVLSTTAFKESQAETTRPLHKAMGSFTSAEMKEVWESTHEVTETAIREIQAQAYEQAIDTAYQHHLTEEQRDHLHTLNPYKEKTQ